MGLASLLVAPLAAAGPVATDLDLELRVSPDRRRVMGVALWEVENRGSTPLESLPFVLYAERYREPPPRVEALLWFRLYPGGFDRGGTHLARALVDDIPAVLRSARREAREPRGLAPVAEKEVLLPAPLAPGDTVRVALHFETRVPRRFGLFGYAEGVMTLEGGFYPELFTAVPGEGPGAPPATPPATVRIGSARGGVALVSGHMRRLAREGLARPVRLPGGQRVALLWSDDLARARSAVAGTEVDVIYPPRPVVAPERPPAGPSLRPDPVHPLGSAPPWPAVPELGRSAEIGEALITARAALRYLQEHTLVPLPASLRIVEVPLRRELAVPGPGVIWLSDRFMRLLPVERLQKFHRVALVRALYEGILREWVGSREAPGCRAWVAEVVAEQLTREFVLEKYGAREDAFDVLAPGAFLKAVDDLLHAPQMPFQTAFFEMVDDTDPLRDQYRLAFGQPLRGGRVYQQLRDRLGETTLRSLIEGYLAAPEGRFVERAEAPPPAFFATWLSSAPPHRAPPGESLGRPLLGGPDGPAPREPCPSACDSPGLQVLLGQIFVSAVPTDGAFSAQADIVVRRRRDLRHSFGITPFVVPGRAGGRLSYRYGFGPRVVANRLRDFVTAGVRAAGIDLDEGSPRLGLMAEVALGRTNLVSPLLAFHATTAVVRARYLVAPSGAETDHGGQLLAAASLLRTPHPRHSVALRGVAGLTWGDVRVSELPTLGGVGGLRALGPSGGRAPHLLTASVEYRHTFTQSLSASVLRLAWWQGLQGVLFVDAGLAAATAESLVKTSPTLGVGYGLRFHAALLGIDPALLSLDLAYPIAFEATPRRLSALNLTIGVTQAF